MIDHAAGEVDDQRAEWERGSESLGRPDGHEVARVGADDRANGDEENVPQATTSSRSPPPATGSSLECRPDATVAPPPPTHSAGWPVRATTGGRDGIREAPLASVPAAVPHRWGAVDQGVPSPTGGTEILGRAARRGYPQPAGGSTAFAVVEYAAGRSGRGPIDAPCTGRARRWHPVSGHRRGSPSTSRRAVGAVVLAVAACAPTVRAGILSPITQHRCRHRHRPLAQCLQARASQTTGALAGA